MLWLWLLLHNPTANLDWALAMSGSALVATVVVSSVRQHRPLMYSRVCFLLGSLVWANLTPQCLYPTPTECACPETNWRVQTACCERG